MVNFEILKLSSHHSMRFSSSLNSSIWCCKSRDFFSFSRELHHHHIKITEVCRDFGMGPGGFYQPSFKNGSKMHLQMMCFGKNWDPKTRLYERQRSTDGALAPGIPDEFKDLVEGAIQASHVVIEDAFKESNAGDILPSMYPDICIVNFYTNNGRLGLHQVHSRNSK